MIVKDQWNFPQLYNLKCLSISYRSLKIVFQLARMQFSIVLLSVGFFLQRPNELINLQSDGKTGWLYSLPNGTQIQRMIPGGCIFYLTLHKGKGRYWVVVIEVGGSPDPHCAINTAWWRTSPAGTAASSVHTTRSTTCYFLDLIQN